MQPMFNVAQILSDAPSIYESDDISLRLPREIYIAVGDVAYEHLLKIALESPDESLVNKSTIVLEELAMFAEGPPISYLDLVPGVLGDNKVSLSVKCSIFIAAVRADCMWLPLETLRRVSKVAELCESPRIQMTREASSYGAWRIKRNARYLDTLEKLRKGLVVISNEVTERLIECDTALQEDGIGLASAGIQKVKEMLLYSLLDANFEKGTTNQRCETIVEIVSRYSKYPVVVKVQWSMTDYVFYALTAEIQRC